jgi:hypothetical protein
MNPKLLLYMFLILILPAGSLVAQEKDTTKPTETGDTLVTDDDWNWDWDWDDFKFNMKMFNSEKSPSISVSYGFSSMNIKNFSGSFTDPNIPELKLGYTSERSVWNEEGILRYKYNYLYLSNFRTDISGTPALNEIETNMWRFGFGWAKGYGYNLGEAAIVPYNSYSIGWSRLDVKNFPQDEASKSKLELYDGSFRFGTGSEAGLRFKIIPQVTLEAAYERSIIFERHLFWKWAGSAVIEAAGQWALDSFINKIMDSSPYAAPIVSFVLKNALSYGIYELRQEKMNWPFKSASPLAYDQFKFGVTFNF